MLGAGRLWGPVLDLLSSGGPVPSLYTLNGWEKIDPHSFTSRLYPSQI